MPYTFTEHTHRFATWCAATAARTSPKCRFSVKAGADLIKGTKLQRWGSGWAQLPNPNEFDQQHKRLRTSLAAKARKMAAIKGRFTDGVAAKFINCYLKAIYVCGVLPKDQASRQKLAALHPPIDWVLLDGIASTPSTPNKTRWRKWRDKGWSNFDSDTYEEVVRGIRSLVDQRGLWSIERNWKGYRRS
jgi:hypothetical protein